MPIALSDIEWSQPLIPAVSDPAWESEIKRRGGQVFDVDRRIAPCHWLRALAFETVSYVPAHIPAPLYRMSVMVVSQESACRYCYGANRAFMKVLGYSEDFIQRLERDLQLAELDEQQRAYIAFARSLARSRPRPGRAARDALVRLGYTPLAVHEMAFAVSITCFYNRVTILLACQPELTMERLANGPLRQLLGVAMRWMTRRAHARRARDAQPVLQATDLRGSPFASVLQPLAGLEAARVMRSALDGAFATGVLSLPAKALVFAVVARTLDCDSCHASAQALLLEQGFSAVEVESSLARLQCDRLSANENRLLAWARGTVHYDVAAVQRETRELARLLGDAAILEAIGIASLANATVRMAMLAE